MVNGVEWEDGFGSSQMELRVDMWPEARAEWVIFVEGVGGN